MNNFFVLFVYDNNVDYGVIFFVDVISCVVFCRNIFGYVNV